MCCSGKADGRVGDGRPCFSLIFRRVFSTTSFHFFSACSRRKAAGRSQRGMNGSCGRLETERIPSQCSVFSVLGSGQCTQTRGGAAPCSLLLICDPLIQSKSTQPRKRPKTALHTLRSLSAVGSKPLAKFRRQSATERCSGRLPFYRGRGGEDGTSAEVKQRVRVV